MLGVIEDSRNEFKVKLPEDLEETVIGFLNSKDGGNIYIGVDDNGKVVGLKNNLDLLQRKMAALLNLTPRMVRYHISELVDNGYIKRDGAKKNGRWIVINKKGVN